jgi:hypothetical protein
MGKTLYYEMGKKHFSQMGKSLERQIYMRQNWELSNRFGGGGTSLSDWGKSNRFTDGEKQIDSGMGKIDSRTGEGATLI